MLSNLIIGDLLEQQLARADLVAGRHEQVGSPRAGNEVIRQHDGRAGQLQLLQYLHQQLHPEGEKRGREEEGLCGFTASRRTLAGTEAGLRG